MKAPSRDEDFPNLQGVRPRMPALTGPLVALLLTATLTGIPARAALGAAREASESELRTLGATLVQEESHDRYSVRVFHTGPAEIREYFGPSDQVFALSWSGSHHPPLGILLGSYGSEYRSAVETRGRRRQRSGRGPFRLSSPDLVIEMSGHFRRLRGRAFDPTLLPSGVGADEIH